MITETDEIAAALDYAATIWPELKDQRAALIRQLIDVGIGSCNQELDAKKAARIAAVKEQAGMFPPHMWDNFREEQLAEWPA